MFNDTKRMQVGDQCKSVESTVRPYLMDAIYCWSMGATFAEIIEMTDIFEGSIICLSRRLDEFLNQLRGAAHAVGESTLEDKSSCCGRIDIGGQVCSRQRKPKTGLEGKLGGR